MTTHNNFCVEMEEIFLEIDNLSKEKYINKYVDIPEIAIIQIKLLNLLLYKALIPKNIRMSYCVSSGLIQIGIDLHEAISNKREENKIKIKNRQLSILAGDYFSSIYYLLLSKSNLVEGIYKLASGITEINTAKMKLYLNSNGQGFDSTDQIIDLLKIRESSLYVQLISELKTEKSREDWKTLIENIIILNYLVNELKFDKVKKNNLSYFLLKHYANKQEKNDLIIAGESSEDSAGLKMLYHKYNIKNKIEDLLISVNDKINKKISSLDDEFIKKELLNLINQINSSNRLKVAQKI